MRNILGYHPEKLPTSFFSKVEVKKESKKQNKTATLGNVKKICGIMFNNILIIDLFIQFQF